MRDCQGFAFRRPIWDAALNTFLTVALVVSVYPQYERIIARRSSLGVSAQYALFQALLSAQNLSSILWLYTFDTSIVDCMKHGAFSAFESYSALIGLIQLFVQWLCALGLLYLVLRHSPTTSSASSENGQATLELFMRFIKYGAALITYVVIFFVPAICFFLNPPLEEALGVGVILAVWTIIYVVPLSAVFSLWQAIPQLWTTKQLQSAHALSPLSLALQTIIFVLLAISWWLRLNPPQFPDRGWSRIFIEWYVRGAWLPVNFGISATAHFAIFLASMTVSTQIVDDDADEQRLLLSSDLRPGSQGLG